MKKNIAWIDTIRVLASFLVIFCHYLMCDGFDHFLRMNVRMYEVAVMCIALFFAISGYLIHPSLERKNSLTDYYRKKIIRLAVPFTVCYLVMSAGMSALSIFDDRLTEKVPLFHALFGAKYFNLLIGMFPLDLNIVKFLGLDVSWFTGEWFMGIILGMFLLSPILDKGAVKAPVLSLLASIALSYVVFNAVEGWEERELIQARWSLCLVRIPEFLFGMILFIHREKLLQWRTRLVIGSLIYLTAQLAYFVHTYPPQGAFFFPGTPACFAVTLPTIYLIFTAVEKINEFDFAAVNWFNSFSGISYMAMLSQHMIIYAFAVALDDFAGLSVFGDIYLLGLITWVIIVISRKLQEFSSPVEKWFLKKREVSTT
ncbi:MAG: acyltransferase [Selenomonadaceae bacterium]|nr:acyltransferase [Selenomonadaceae bacterium]